MNNELHSHFRLREEIEKIRYLYNSYEGEMRISIQGIFEAKVII